MSKNFSNKMSELDDLINKHGKNGLRALLVFKLLKTKLSEEVKSNNPYAIIDENILNSICVKKAQQLVKLGKDKPTEKDFEELLSKLKDQGTLD